MNWSKTLVLGGCLALAFLCGRLTFEPVGAAGLSAQGRGAVNPPARPPGQPTSPSPGTPPPPLVYTEDGGQSAAGNGFLAVTGSYGMGTSVLYLVDTNSRQLAVYEARGGSAEQRRVVLVGARRIDLDLQLEGYNDESEYDYRRLRDVFQKRGRKDHEVSTGLTPSEGDGK
jgi:hypothetical protein